MKESADTQLACNVLLSGIEPFTKREEGHEGFRTVQYRVHGFWNDGYVTIYQSRHLRTGQWREPEISWASGGRDVKQQSDDKKAAMCFALALQDAAEHSAGMSR